MRSKDAPWPPRWSYDPDMDADEQPPRGASLAAAALRGPLLLLAWATAVGVGYYLGVSLEIAAIMALPQHPIMAALLPVAVLTGAAIAVWRRRWSWVWLVWVRLAFASAAASAIITGPTFLAGLKALASF